MAHRFGMKLAGLAVELRCAYPSLEAFCGDYVVPLPETPDIVATCTPAEIAAEQARGENIPAEAAESLCLYRAIARQLPAFGAAVFHGAAISYGDGAYLFTAPSGTGKSTHIRLWRKYLGPAVDIVNGDKPILKLTTTGVEVCSTPWAGKEGWQKNRILPLRGLCLLRRGAVNRIRPADPAELVEFLLSQVYLPAEEAALSNTLSLLDTVCRRVPLFVLECTIAEEAVKVAFPALTGQPYPEREARL